MADELAEEDTRVQDISGPLLASIYAALDRRGQWSEALHNICDYIGTTYAAVLTLQFAPEPKLLQYLIWGVSDEDALEYMRRWAAQDPWQMGKTLSDLPVGTVADSVDFCSDEILEENSAYVHFLKGRGLHYGAGAFLLGNDRLRIMLGTLRPKAAGRMTSAELGRLRALVPHLQRVLRIQDEHDGLATERDLLKGIFNMTGLGLMLLDQGGGLLTTNSRARAILDARTHLAEIDGRLRAVSRRDDQQLQEAIRRAIDKWDKLPRGETLSIEPKRVGCDGPVLRLLIVPAQAGKELNPSATSPAALVHILDSAVPPRIDEDLLRQLLSFSRAEAQVAAKLASGLSVAETAVALHISEHTVRSHLKNLFLKSGTNQQSALVSLILRLQAPLPIS